MPRIPSVAGLMPGPVRTLIALLAGNPGVPLLPLAAFRMIVRVGG